MKSLFLLIIALLLIRLVGVAQVDHIGALAIPPAHPRILLLKGEEETLKHSIKADANWTALHHSLLTECDQMITTAPVEHIKIGRRLLDKSREALRRIFFLSYAWRMTHQDKYLKRAEIELLAIANFSDWNPSHFLDVAEMTMAAAIGYDWLYNDLSESSRSTIRTAILEKGINPSLDPKNNGWLKNTNNWNQVCNAGMAYGAMAIYEDQPGAAPPDAAPPDMARPQLAKQIINRAIDALVLPMGEYKPDGAYPEGYSYWGYGTSFNVMLISALDKLYGQNFGLAAQPGFMNTAGYLENMVGPSGAAFNYSDSGPGGELQPSMFWFAAKQKDPSLLWVERRYLLDPTETKRQLRDRLLPAALIWGSGINLTALSEPKNLFWTGAGKNPVALMRTSWSDPAAIYVGMKGGSPGLSHAHMDAGSFVMDADGLRWAMDFGMQQYESLESKGVDLWNMRQNSQRWQVFRYNNRAHNTLTVNDSLQRVGGRAPITGFSASPLFMQATTNLTDLYEGELTRANRGIAIIDRAYVAVRDELETGAQAATIRWTMLTEAAVKLTAPNQAELTQQGKKLILRVSEPATITLKTWPTDPTHDYDTPNPGTTFVGFEVQLPPGTKTALTVLLIPGKSAGRTIQPVKSLQQWPN